MAEQRAALAGRAALKAYLPAADFDRTPSVRPTTFSPADHAALEGTWSWFNDIVGRAMARGIDGMVDDVLAAARP